MKLVMWRSMEAGGSEQGVVQPLQTKKTLCERNGWFGEDEGRIKSIAKCVLSMMKDT